MKQLVGKGKPFYSAVDKAAGLLKRKAGTGAEFMKELMALPGIKQSEITERGLGELMGAPKMTHEQFMAALAAKPAPAIRENVLGEEPSPSDVRKQATAMMKDMASEYASDAAESSKEYRAIKADELRRMRKVGMMDTLLDSAKYDLYQEPHHEKYTLPGGENYREMLIKAPEEGGEMFRGVTGHFGGEPGILASMRLKDRLVPDLEGPHNVTIIGGGGVSNKKFNTREEANAFADVKHQGGYKTKITPLNNKKYLHLEELQSDWHQQGREKGYADPDIINQLQKKYRELDEISKAQRRAAIDRQVAIAVSNGMDEAEARRLLILGTHNTPLEQFAPDEESKMDILRRQQELEELENQRRLPPDAPFKKNWEEMALKRLVHHAAEKGYHGIVVTPGEEQADRYNLAEHVGYLAYHPEEEHFKAYGHNRNEITDQTGIEPHELQNYIGKEVADRLLSAPQVMGYHQLEGENIKFGGHGMKAFYDKKVPNILNAIGKKYGVKTQLHGHRLPGHPSQRGEASERLGLAHVPLAEMTTPQAQAFNQKLDDANAKQLHHFPITEEMRKDVLTNGLPLHKEGGIIHKAVGGQVQPSINQMRMSLMANGKSQFGDIQNIGANEAPGMDVKAYINPDQQRDGIMPVGGVSMGNQPLPMGGVDMSRGQPGQQLSPPGMTPPPQQGQQQPQGGLPSSAGPSSPAQQPPSNILQMTPQGQALNAMTPPQQPAKMKDGGRLKKPEVRPTVFDDSATRRNPKIEAAARALMEGEMKQKAYEKLVAKEKPVKPYEFVPMPATEEDALRAIGEKKMDKWKAHDTWPAGRRVGLRLDIPSYERHGVWMNTIHDEEGTGENKLPTAHGPVSSVRNAVFEGSPEKAIRVATGEQNKNSFAKIMGELEHINEEDALKHMIKYLRHPEYRQVGYDPRRHGDFYDRETMEPITHAEHVVQIGPLVLAKNPKYGKRKLYSDGGDVGHYASKGRVKQTVKNAQRIAYPGIYGNPEEIAALAASRVAPEDPLLSQLFGVTRADMFHQAHGRQGMPHLGMLPGAAANPKGSMATEGVMNPRNEQRLIDVMSEAQKHQGLRHGMEPWYYMDPLFDRMVQLLGLQKATEEYKKMNALMGMASSSSEVNTEIPRGSLAYYLQNQGRFKEFEEHGGKRSEARPADFGETPGHLAHKTAHALPMRKFLERGEVDMNSPKVPMYIEASGVPATGFQTRTPVGDAHWSRAVGLADTRNPKTIKGQEVVPGASVSTPEMSALGPWWKHKIASKIGLESVPAQALAWGAFSPQTGVTTPIGAPKLELIAKQIGQTAQRLGVSPQTARDLVLTGKERMGKKNGGSARLSTNMDTINLELMNKRKKAK